MLQMTGTSEGNRDGGDNSKDDGHLLILLGRHATAPNHQGTAGKELAPSSGTPRSDGGDVHELALNPPQPSMVPHIERHGGYGFGPNLTHDGEGFGSRMCPAD